MCVLSVIVPVLRIRAPTYYVRVRLLHLSNLGNLGDV